MDSIDSYAAPGPWAAAVKGAVQAGILTAAAAAVLLCCGPGLRDAAWGLGCAWLVSSLCAAALLVAQPVSLRAYWGAFWGGMAARLAVLGGLMAWCWGSSGARAPALLVAYVLGVAFLLPVELRQVLRR